MSPAQALQFSAPDLIDAEWEEMEERMAEGPTGHQRQTVENRQEALAKWLRIGQADGSPTDLDALKAEVAMVVAGGRGAGPAWPTGVALLDEALGGGVPRGRVTEVVGPLGAGKTSLVRQLVAEVLTRGGWVAWVDATRTLAPQELAGLGERLVVVRPRDYTRGAWCADLLLRSGVFALVVMDGAPVLSRTLGVRLSQLARERDAAFVVLREGTQGSRLGGAVRLQVRPLMQEKSQAKHTRLHAHANAHSHTPAQASMEMTNTRKFSVLVEKGGSSRSSYRTVEVTCAIVVARRVCTDTEIPDRRGVARRTRTIAGTGSEHAQSESGISRESVRTESVVQPTHQSIEHSAGNGQPQHATDAPASRKSSNDGGSASGAWTGRGRPRMAESGYGRSTRRGKARQFLHAREHTREHTREHSREHHEYHDAYQRQRRSDEAEQQSQARRESRRQSQRELQQYARSLG